MTNEPYFKDADDAMAGHLEPKVPCRHIKTRPCVDLTAYQEPERLRTKICEPKDCTRYPILDGRLDR